MSWLEQLKSVFRRKSTSVEAATEADTQSKADAVKTEEPVTVTEDTSAAKVVVPETEPPVATPEDVTEKAAGAALAQTPATATETTEAVVVDPEPATEATPATDSSVSGAAEEPTPAKAETTATESAATEPATEAPATVEPATPAAKPAPAAKAAKPAAAKKPAAPRREAANPAISTLDVEGITAELKSEGPYGPGSGKPAADGSAPSGDFTVKGKESSKLFHTEKSPYFTRTKADVWFKTEADAQSAGFQAWDHKKRAGAKK